eukprot:594853-Pleurochrysis_carterae.AAC.12
MGARGGGHPFFSISSSVRWRQLYGPRRRSPSTTSRVTAARCGAGRSASRSRASNSACTSALAKRGKRWYKWSNQRTVSRANGASHARSVDSVAPFAEATNSAVALDALGCLAPSAMCTVAGAGSARSVDASQCRGKWRAKAA